MSIPRPIWFGVDNDIRPALEWRGDLRLLMDRSGFARLRRTGPDEPPIIQPSRLGRSRFAATRPTNITADLVRVHHVQHALPFVVSCPSFLPGPRPPSFGSSSPASGRAAAIGMDRFGTPTCASASAVVVLPRHAIACGSRFVWLSRSGVEATSGRA